MLLDTMNVVSFCHVLQGPAATQYLGDMGANIIKVEPLAGERGRRWAGAEMDGLSGLYFSAFRNKRLIAIDLKSDEGREIVFSLIEKADVVVENFRHGVMARLGLSYEDIRRRKPDIIYASGTGWGGKGPMLSRESQDLIIQARTGLAAATGTQLKEARAVGSAVVDQHGGALLALGILGAYVRKLATGKGMLVESSLFAAGFDLQTEPLTVFMSSRPGANVLNRDSHLATWYHHAPYGIYPLLDGEMALSTNPIRKLAEALNSDDLRSLKDAHPYKDRDKIAKAVARELEQRRFSDVAPKFDAEGIWYGKVQNFDDVSEDPQAKAMDIFQEVEVDGHKVTLVNHPIRYDGQTPKVRIAGSVVGQHTREILKENGYSDEQIDDLFTRKVIAGL